MLLCALLPALLTGAPAFAEDYPEGSVYQGLSGILPEDSLTLPADTEWATLTASWGLQVTFYDWDLAVLQTELIPEELLPGSTSAPADPVRSGYTFTGWARCDESWGNAWLHEDGSVTDLTGPGPIEFIALYSPVYYVWLGKLAENLPYDTEDYNHQPFFTYDFSVSPVVYDGAAGGYREACAPGDVITLKVAAYDSSGGEWADTGTEKTVTVNSSGHIELSLLPGEAVGFPLSSGVSGEQGFVVSERWVQEPCEKNQPAAQIYCHGAAAGADVREALSTLNYTETSPGEIFHASPYDPHYESVFSAGSSQCLLSCREIPDGPTILQSAIIVNRYAPKHSLSVSKVVLGNVTEQLFPFEVTVQDENGDPVILYHLPTTGSYTVEDNKIRFSLKDGESICLEGIPGWSTATVKELSHDGYSTQTAEGTGSRSRTDSVEVSMEEDRSIIFYNSPEITGVELPETGGPGSEPFVWAGLALVLGSLLCVLRRRESSSRCQ